MDVFIDTNIFLDFYHLTSDDLEELEKLTVLLQRGRVRLWLPEQVEAEFWRNRETKIADALKGLRAQNLSLQFPAMCKDYDEYQKLRQYQQEYGKEHASLVEKISEAVKAENLKADMTIRRLFAQAQTVSTDKEILDRARLRFDVGNPPGKKGSLGDAINWEALLAKVPDESDLYFVTDDKDYYSPIDNQRFNTFLLDEWMDAKEANLVPYKRLSAFFVEHFPEIKLATEVEEVLLIRDLAASGSFAGTHTLVAKLRKRTHFTPAQRNEIVSIALNNDQVYLIMRDPDVEAFLTDLVAGHEDEIDPQNLKLLKKALEVDDESFVEQ